MNINSNLKSIKKYLLAITWLAEKIRNMSQLEMHKYMSSYVMFVMLIVIEAVMSISKSTLLIFQGLLDFQSRNTKWVNS